MEQRRSKAWGCGGQAFGEDCVENRRKGREGADGKTAQPGQGAELTAIAWVGVDYWAYVEPWAHLELSVPVACVALRRRLAAQHVAVGVVHHLLTCQQGGGRANQQEGGGVSHSWCPQTHMTAMPQWGCVGVPAASRATTAKGLAAGADERACMGEAVTVDTAPVRGRLRHPPGWGSIPSQRECKAVGHAP